MINERKEAQSEIEIVMLEELVPQDHLLRKIEPVNNFVYSKFPLGNNEWFLKFKFYLVLSKYRFYWHFKYYPICILSPLIGNNIR